MGAVARALTEGGQLALARRGDGDAYASLVRTHSDIAFRTAMLITQDAAEAEEAAQDAFVKAWRALGRFREGEPFRPWLLTIVANEARNRRRSAGRREPPLARAARRAAGGRVTRLAEAGGDRGVSARATLLSALGRMRRRRPRSCSAAATCSRGERGGDGRGARHASGHGEVAHLARAAASAFREEVTG